MPRTKPGPKGRTNRSLTGEAPCVDLPAAPAYLGKPEGEQFSRIVEQIGARYRPGMEYDVESLAIALVVRGQMLATLQAEGWFIEGSKGSKVRHPAVDIMHEQQRAIFQLTAALGLTRRERSDRVKDPKPGRSEAPQPVDPLAAALEEQLG